MIQGLSWGEYWSWFSLRTSFEAKCNFGLPEWNILNDCILGGKQINCQPQSQLLLWKFVVTLAPSDSLWDPSFSSRESQQQSPFTTPIWSACPWLLPRLIQPQKFKVIPVSSGRRSSVFPRVIFRIPPRPPGVQMVRSGPEEGEWQGKSSTMTSLTWCPTWRVQLDFTALLQHWIYDFSLWI